MEVDRRTGWQLLSLGVFEVAAIEAWDPKVAAKMEQIDRTKVPGDSYKGQALWRFRKDNSAADVDTVENQPDVGSAVLQRAFLAGVGGDQVLPPAQVIGLPNGIH